jgi:tetratricopeptide (TPR) repeat protein
MDSIKMLLDHTSADTLSVNLLIEKAKNYAWSDIKTAEIYARKALVLSEEIEYLRGLAYSKYQIALLFKDYDFKIAEKLTLEALEHARELKDSILLGSIFNTIGNMKDNVNESNNAEKYYNRALQVFKGINNDSLKAKVYNNLGILYDNREKFDTAQLFFKNAAAANLQKKNFLGLAINYLNLGYSYILSGDHKKGLAYLNKSHEIALSNDYQRIMPYIYNNYSEYYLDKRNYSEAAINAEKGLSVARDHHNRLQERYALQLLKEAYFNDKNLLKAYECAEELISVNDSINQYKKLKEIDLLEMRYAFEQERDQQQYQRELLKAKIRQKELSVTLIALGGGLAIVLLVFLYVLQHSRMKRKNLEQKATLLEKEKLQQQLEFKNKELTTNVMYLVKKNEFITDISKKLKNTDLVDDDQKNNTIDRIIAEMDRSISEDNWADFEMRFQEVHIDFYNKLSKQFSDLTPNDLRLCAFLRLNMTSKEIAGITYQSVDSLKTARYRLRKKLGLSREDNLIGFLTQI